MTLLAPFDNLLGGRTMRLFGFDYIHENFLPENKRKFGTFVHPILWGDKFIGRTDLRMDKESKKLNVLSVHAEPSTPSDKEIGAKVGETMKEFAEFLGRTRSSTQDGCQWPGGVPCAERSMPQSLHKLSNASFVQGLYTSPNGTNGASG